MRELDIISANINSIVALGQKLMFQVEEVVKDAGEKDVIELPQYVPSENELYLCETLKENNLFQLGPHLIYLLSSVIGGVSNIIIGPPSAGKTKCMGIARNLIPCMKSGDKLADTKSLKGVIENDKKNYLMIDDLTTIVFKKNSDAPSELFTTLSSLIQRHEFEDRTLDISFKNVQLTMLGGCTHLAFETLANNPIWESMVSSRILRYYILYYRRPQPPIFVSDDFFPDVSGLELDLDNLARVEDSIDIEPLRAIYSAQLPSERTGQFILKILQGHATLCGRDSVSAEDVEWLKLYEPCITAERYLRERDKIDPHRLVVLYAMFKVSSPEIKLVADEARLGIDKVRNTLLSLAELLRFNVFDTTYQQEKSEFSLRLKHLHETYSLGGN